MVAILKTSLIYGNSVKEHLNSCRARRTVRTGALTQRCVGASVFLGSPKCIAFLREFTNRVAPEAIGRLQQAIARAALRVAFGQHYRKVVKFGQQGFPLAPFGGFTLAVFCLIVPLPATQVKIQEKA